MRRRRGTSRALTDGGEPPEDADAHAPAPGPSRALDAVAAAVEDADAAGFVHVGDRFDPDLRALVGFDGPDRHYAAVHDAERATWTCLAPSLYDGDAERAFPGAVRPADGRPTGERAAALLAEATEGGRVLVPPGLPHDAAIRLERAGFALESTDAVRAARADKGDAEVAAVRRAQTAAVAGVERAAAVLRSATIPGGSEGDREDEGGGDRDRDADADAETGAGAGAGTRAVAAGNGADDDEPRPDDDEPRPDDAAPVLHVEDAPLTTVRLRRRVDAAVAGAGADPAANTVVAAGAACADLHYRGDRPVRAGETVLVDVSPRAPDGYHGDCTRTFVVAGSGGWERRAHVACEAALRAGIAAAEPGAPARRVHDEVAAELAAYGFPVEYGADAGFTHAAGHGVGLALHEAPSLRGGDDRLRAGTTLAVEPGVYDPERGGVRVEDVVVVREDGAEVLVGTPRSLVP